MKGLEKILALMLLLAGCCGICRGAEIPATIEQIQTDGQLLLKVPKAADLVGASGEVYYSVIAEGSSREIVVAGLRIEQVVDGTHVLARLIQPAAPVQPGFNVRLTPAAAAPAAPVPAATPAPASAGQPVPIPADQYLEHLVYIPGGTATIGLDKKNAKFWNETPAHPVNLEPYYIDQTEVTMGQYAKFVQATDHRLPPGWDDDTPPKEMENLPVVGVDWKDADAYARWMNRRLPTEEEWEWAGRSGRGFLYPWGDNFIEDNANTQEAKRDAILPVGSYPPDRSPFGVIDLAGNVSEWTLSFYRPYPGNTHQEDYDPDHRVIRGGAFSVDKKFSRVPYRAAQSEDYRCSDVGFRTAISMRELDELIRLGIVQESRKN